jgi:altronate hydrolase
MSQNQTITRIHAQDNVVVALTDLAAGSQIVTENGTIELAEAVDKGHKIAIRPIAEGENIIKYGYPIGHATAPVQPGHWIHTHNIATNLSGNLEYSYQPDSNPASVSNAREATFMGYKRKDGSVGIRNEIWIVNTVGCVNKTAEALAKQASQMFAGRVDGVFSFTHPFGCSQLGDDHEMTQVILADMVKHPNAGGVLVLGLGCENNNIPEFKKVLGDYDEGRLRFLSTQDVPDEMDEGLRLIEELVEYAETFHREPCPASKLVVGLKCGGSDAFSGITANPLLGRFSDRLIEAGGASVLTEVPEMFGAETILMNRCVDESVFDKTVLLINNFKEYYVRHNQVIYENPSPGNKKGGISTLEEKSLGCTQKGGNGTVVDVVPYGGRITKTGLNLLQGPGNDIVAVTALMAAGAHVILFTTGRGTPLGAPVPTVKVSSNSDLAARKSGWIDFNAGRMLEGESMDTLTDELFQFVLDVASGEKQTKNERNGYREISIFKDGVTL